MPKTIKTNKLATPFVKWVGGKRQLIKEIDKHIPDRFTKYYEPFVGGGAVLLHLQPKNAVINDSNSELTNLYNVIKNSPDALIGDLKKHKNDEEYFYHTRMLDRDQNKYLQLTDIERASRIIFLNKTCYNGLFRVNSAGEFNAPFGRYKNPAIVNEITIKAVSKYLSKNNIQILNVDYKKALARIRKDSFVYFDPPYDPVSDSSNFTGYTKNGFNKEDQIHLRNLCNDLHTKGVKFLLSNSATELIIDLYKDYNIIHVNAKRSVNSNTARRGEIAEVLVKNYE